MARKQGGRVPLGYRRVKHGLEIDSVGADLVRLIFRLASRGGKGSHRIAAELRESTGRRWSPTTIDGILANETYMQMKPGRIVAPKVWHAALRARLARRKRAA